ncbi:MAG: 30S ribosomal protein S20 [Thermodesulfobacteriota bacterium]|nr:30S ribosomal protein S20 [Thermodesulfobacteriota bacterium]
MIKHKSAIKRARQSKKRHLINRHYLSRMRNSIKGLIEVIKEKKKDEATNMLRMATSIINETACRGMIHKKNASRKISRLTKKVNAIN